MSKLSVPTAIVLAALILGWIVLLVMGKPVPDWLLGIGPVLGMVVTAVMRSLVVDGSTTTAAKVAKTIPPVSVLALALAGCANGVPTPQTVQDVTVGLNAAACILETFPADIAAGKGEVDAVADCVIRCGVSAAQATGLLDRHRKAEALEGIVAKPAASR